MRFLRLAAGSILALIVIVAVLIWRADRMLDEPYFGSALAEVFVDIAPGTRAHDIAAALAHAGVIKNSLLFEAFVRWRGLQTELKAGEYRFDAPASPRQIVRRIIQGNVFSRSVTIPEGFTVNETVAQLAAAGIGGRQELERASSRSDLILDLDRSAQSLEGYLFPDTYLFARNTRSEQVIAALVRRFREKYARLIERHPPAPGWTVRRVVVLASIIEKEARVSAEREVIASVLMNRLDRGMPLAVDPTVIYALKLIGIYDGNIRKRDLTLDSPFNTYLRPGLPPGPICNPGEASLRAVLAPAGTDYLYYVSRNDGTHEFSKDYRSHAKAVARYQPSSGASRSLRSK